MSEQKLARDAPEPSVRAAWLGDAAEQPPQTKERPVVDFRRHERAPKGFKTEFAVKGRGSKRKLEEYREQVVAMALSLLQECGRLCCWAQPRSIKLPKQRCDGGLQVERDAAIMQDDIPEVASISRSKRAKMNVDGLAKVRATLLLCTPPSCTGRWTLLDNRCLLGGLSRRGCS